MIHCLNHSVILWFMSSTNDRSCLLMHLCSFWKSHLTSEGDRFPAVSWHQLIYIIHKYIIFFCHSETVHLLFLYVRPAGPVEEKPHICLSIYKWVSGPEEACKQYEKLKKKSCLLLFWRNNNKRITYTTYNIVHA